MKKNLVIEHLTWYYLAYALCVKPAYGKIYFTRMSAYLRNQSLVETLERIGIYRLRLRDFDQQGVYFTLQNESLATGETFFEKRIAPSRNYRAVVSFFKMNDASAVKFSAAIKHTISDYYFDSIKTLRFAEQLCRNQAPRCIFSELSDLTGIVTQTQPSIRIHNALRNSVRNACAGLRMVAALCATIRAFSIYPKKKRYQDLTGSTLGYFPFHNSYHRDQQHRLFYFDTVIYDRLPGQPLHPSNILHIFPRKVTDRYTKEFLEKKGARSIVVTDIPLATQFLKEAFRAIRTIPLAPLPGTGVNGYENVFKLIFWNLFFSKLPLSTYYISYDSQFSKLALTALSIQKKTSISATYATGHCAVLDAHLAYDHFGIYSRYYKSILENHYAHNQTYYVCGVPRSDIVYGFTKISKCNSNTVSKIKERYRLVTAFDFGGKVPYFSEDIFSEQIVIRFYQGLFALLKEHNDIFIISKIRNSATLKEYADNPMYRTLQQHISEQPRLRLEWELNTYKLIAESDMLITNNISTTGIEALAAKKKVIFYDLWHIPQHIGTRFGIVAHNEQELQNTFRRVYSGTGDYEWEKIHTELCGGYFDGKCRNRIRSRIKEILEEQKQLQRKTQ